jgi:hypothetical protein
MFTIVYSLPCPFPEAGACSSSAEAAAAPKQQQRRSSNPRKKCGMQNGQ